MHKISFLFFSLFCIYVSCANEHRRKYSSNIPLTTIIDSIFVLKSQRVMYVYSKGRVQKTYSISLGANPIGAKEVQGDNKTPEGLYTINDRNPYSVCHKNLGISYPNERDRAHAKRLHKPTGGDVKIHGLLNGTKPNQANAYLNSDWTWGCIGVSDSEIDELYIWVKEQCPILIKP